MTSDEPSTRRPPTRPLAAVLGALALAEVVTAVVATVLAGRDFTSALNSFVVTDAMIGATFPACGLLIAWHRPRNPIGWLLLAGGICYAASAAAEALRYYGASAGWPAGSVRVLDTVFVYAWPWSIGLILPLLLQLFPTGRPVHGRVWRWLVVASAATAPLFVLQLAADPAGNAYLALPGYDRLGWLWTVSNLRFVLANLIGLVSLGVRYRRGEDTLRRQLLWPMLAVLLLLVASAPWALIAGTPVYVLFAIPLVPVGMTIAILRYRLLDIRLVVSRAVLYVLLSTLVIGVYIGLVIVTDRLLRNGNGAEPGASAVITVVIAIGFNPVRVRLQRLVDRLLYGDRTDPVRAVSRVGARLGTGLPGVVTTVRDALRVPFAALRVHDVELASAGSAPEVLHTIPLAYGEDRVGELLVGLRPGERRLGGTDRAVLELLAAPLSVAVHAVDLARQLQRSREAIVLAREEERRRLRRDLHDGLGPVLTGVTYKADAAGNLLRTDPDQTRRLLTELRGETAQAIDDIRRLVYDLRPPALDDLGLAGAIRQRATLLDRAGLEVHVDAPELPPLPAAVEAAAYRIAVEALVNAARHANAGRVQISVRADDKLHIEVRDNGGARAQGWTHGVGLSSMRERAAELGGTCVAGPGPDGGLVVATLPLEVP